MSYTIEYKKGDYKKALTDARAYTDSLTKETCLRGIAENAKSKLAAYRAVRLSLSLFLGIHGYPARVFAFWIVFGRLPK